MIWKRRFQAVFYRSIEAQDMTYVSNSRHIALLHQALQAIEDAIDAGMKWGHRLILFKSI